MAEKQQPTNVTRPESASGYDHNSSVCVVSNGGSSISIARNGRIALSSPNNNNLLHVPLQAEEESNSKLHIQKVNDKTPLLGSAASKREYRKMIIKRFLMISIFLVIVLTLAIFVILWPISHLLSQLHSRNITVFNPQPNAENIVELTQVNGDPAKELQLSAMTSEKDESFNVMSVYNLKKPKITWSNSTVNTTLDNHPMQPYYALPGSVVTFNISSINFEEEEEDVSFTLQLLNEADNLLCKKTFEVEFPVNNNDSLNIIHTCVISETDYYRVWYNGKGSAEARMTYDTSVLDVSGLKPTCHLNEFTNCTLFPSFREKSFVILKFKNIDYSTFTVQIVYIPRTELYFFVLLAIPFVAAVFGLVSCMCFLYRFIRKKGKLRVFLKGIKH